MIKIAVCDEIEAIKYRKKIDELKKQLPSGEKIPIATRKQQKFMKGLLWYQREEVR